MNITKIGMNSTTFGIDPRQTYNLQVEDVVLKETKAPKSSTIEVDDVFISKRKQPITHTEFTFKKDRLSKNTKNPYLKNGLIYTGKTDIILPKEAQKAQLLKEIDKEENIVFFSINENKRFGKGVSFSLENYPMPNGTTVPLVDVKEYKLSFNKEANKIVDMKTLPLNGSFKDFAKATIKAADNLGQVTVVSKNNEEENEYFYNQYSTK